VPHSSEWTKAQIWTDAAIVDFCNRLSRPGQLAWWEFEENGSSFVFEELLTNGSRSLTNNRLDMLWFVLSTACVRAPKTFRRIVHDIDQSTAEVIKRDREELAHLGEEMRNLSGQNKTGRKDVARIRKLDRLIAGKEKIIVAEARKVDCLYGLVPARKPKTYGERVKKAIVRNKRSGLDVSSLVGKEFWDSGVS
jgi:hypothetical protein